MHATLFLRQALSFQFAPSGLLSALMSVVAGGLLFHAAPAQAELAEDDLGWVLDGEYGQIILKSGDIAQVGLDVLVSELGSTGGQLVVDGSDQVGLDQKVLWVTTYKVQSGENSLVVKGNNGDNNVAQAILSDLRVESVASFRVTITSGGALYWGTAEDFYNWQSNSKDSTGRYPSVLCIGLGPGEGDQERGTGVKLTPSMSFAVGEVGDASGNLVVGKGGVLAFQDSDEYSYYGERSGKLTAERDTTVQFLPGSRIWIISEADLNGILLIEDGAKLLGIDNATLLRNNLEYSVTQDESGFRITEKAEQFRGVFGPALRALYEARQSGDAMLPAFWSRFFENAVSFDMAGGSAENWAGLPAATGSDRALVDATAVTGGLVARGARLLRDADAVERTRREAEAAKRDAKTGASTHRFSLGVFPIEVDVTERRSDFGFTLTERSVWDFRREETGAGVTLYGRLKDGWWGMRIAGATADINTEVVRTNRFSGESDLVTVGGFFAWPFSWGTLSGTVAWAQANDSAKMATADVFMTTNDVEQTIWSAGLGWTSPVLVRGSFEGTLETGLRWMHLTGSGGRTLADAETIFTTEFSSRNLFEATLGVHGEYAGAFAVGASEGLFSSMMPRAWSVVGDLGLRALAGDADLEMDVRFAGVDAPAGRLMAEGLGVLTVDASVGARLLWRESELEASFGCARDTGEYSSVWGGVKAVVHF